MHKKLVRWKDFAHKLHYMKRCMNPVLFMYNCA